MYHTTTMTSESLATLGRTDVSGDASLGEHQQHLINDAGQQQVLSNSVINYWTPAEASALIHALIASFSVIMVSELGDKTFIITAIMAMKNSRGLVFLSSALALFLMTVLSVGMGVAVTVIPALYTHYASIVLFLCFGFKMLKEAYDMKDQNSEDFEEVERNLSDQEDSRAGEVKVKLPMDDTEREEEEDEVKEKMDADKRFREEKPRLSARLFKNLRVAPIIIKVFTMIFIAEWGDRSQISTVVLAAREDIVGVFVGSFLGHIFCTGLAVVGGRFVADMISVRTMTLLGGLVFLFFAFFAVFSGPE